MSGFSFRSLTFVLFIAFLVWFSCFDSCIARRGKHWRQSRATSSSLSKKKRINHGSSHHHNSRGSKPKPPSHKTPSLTPPAKKPPKEYTPSIPPQQSSATFNVIDFGAKGDGKTDDTKVSLQSHLCLFNEMVLSIFL